LMVLSLIFMIYFTIGMPAHPSISLNDAHTIVKYIMNIKDNTINTLPLKGLYTAKIPDGDNGNGTYIIRAAYTDKGNKTIPKLTSDATIILRSSELNPASAEIKKGVLVKVNGQEGTVNVIPNANGYIGFKKLDITGIKQIELKVITSLRENNSGGIIEIRLDSPTGVLLGQTLVESAVEAPRLATAPSIKADVKETTGVHDVYFVFKNDKAKAIEPLMLLGSIRFSDEKK